MKKLFNWAWGFVPEPAKVYVMIGGVVAVIALLGFTVYKIQDWGYTRSETKNEQKAVVAVKDKLDKKAKQDEIQNAPIDNSVTVRRMRNHSF